MANIELVIKIDEDIYKLGNSLIFPLLNKDKAKAFQDMMVKAITNGTPLPKGHGTLKDVDELHSIFKEKCDAYNIDNLSFISDMDMHFDLAPTIIEADKESEDAKQ